MKKKIYYIVTLAVLMLVASSCGDQFLEMKANRNQRIPVSIEDYQAILDMATNNQNPINIRSNHTLSMVAADDIYLEDQHWITFPVGPAFDYQKNVYLWKRDVYLGSEGFNIVSDPIDYTLGFNRILTANIVIDGLETLSPEEQQTQAWKTAMGNALFHRAWNYYTLAQLYSPVYSADNLIGLKGLPLREEPDPTKIVPRASLADTYTFILKDLLEAEEVLTETPINVYRASRSSVRALLIRLFLQMGDYQKVIQYADLLYSAPYELMDYNMADVPLSNYSFSARGEGNSEVIFMVTASDRGIYYNRTLYNPNPDLLEKFNADDSRKDLFFRQQTNGRYQFIGSYNGDDLLFTGLALDEVYLNEIEAAARLNDLGRSVSSLNKFCSTRYQNWQDLTEMNTDLDNVLDIVREERYKQLCMRGIRWEDLRRWSKEPGLVQKMTRLIEGEVFTLSENELRSWAWFFPEAAVIHGGYNQN